MQSSYIKDTSNYKGFQIQIIQDSDPQNPRTEHDNLGTMVCWHSRYLLGDMDGSSTVGSNYADSCELFSEISGIDENSDYCMRIYDKQGHEALTAYLYEQAKKKAIILPLYLYDHSGITMSTSSFNDSWDSGTVGYIYITLAAAKKEYSIKKVTKAWRNKLAMYLTDEVETYDQYLTGDVWGFNVIDPGENDIDSCWGFYGDEGIKQAISDAEGSINYHIKQTIKKHCEQVKTWIKNKVPLYARTPLRLTA